MYHESEELKQLKLEIKSMPFGRRDADALDTVDFLIKTIYHKDQSKLSEKEKTISNLLDQLLKTWNKNKPNIYLPNEIICTI